MANVRLLYVEVPVRPARVHAPQGTSTALRSPARGFCARILSFSFFFFILSMLVSENAMAIDGEKNEERHLKMICLSFVQKFSASYQRSRGDLSDYLALRRLSKMNACTVRVRNRSRRRRISKRWKKQLWWIRKIFSKHILNHIVIPLGPCCLTGSATMRKW